MEEEGPYVFKELSSQDQMVLIKLQYEGKIKELEGIVEKQKEELNYYRERSEDHIESNHFSIFLRVSFYFRLSNFTI